MSCKRFGPAIAAHAAGAAIDASAGRHLGECEACRRVLDTQVRLLAELDAELGRTLAISASPDFAARSARAAREAGKPTAQRRIPRPVWAGLGMAAAIVLAVWVGGTIRLKPEATQTARGRAEFKPDGTQTSTPAVQVKPQEVQAASRNHRLKPGVVRPRKRSTPDCVVSGFSRKAAACASSTPSAAEPPVIVEPSRALAIQRFRELMSDGRLDGGMLPPPRTPEAILAELIVAPLAISEITVPDVEIVSRPPAASEAAVSKESYR
jgi:hypothetical protein